MFTLVDKSRQKNKTTIGKKICGISWEVKMKVCEREQVYEFRRSQRSFKPDITFVFAILTLQKKEHQRTRYGVEILKLEEIDFLISMD